MCVQFYLPDSNLISIEKVKLIDKIISLQIDISIKNRILFIYY